MATRRGPVGFAVSRVLFSLSIQVFSLSLAFSAYPALAAPRQLAVTSQLGTPSVAAINNVKGKKRTGISIVHCLSFGFRQDRMAGQAVRRPAWKSESKLNCRPTRIVF